MKRDDTSLVKDVLNTHKEMNALTTDKIDMLAPKADIEVDGREILKQQCITEGYQWIEPRRTLPAIGKLPERLRKQRDHDWEYVRGIYENFVVSGETVRFWLTLYPGDKDCLWEIPANKPVYVPRMVARHLEDVQKYHTFGHIQKPENLLYVDSETHTFTPTGTHYRGKFRPIGAFS